LKIGGNPRYLLQGLQHEKGRHQDGLLIEIVMLFDYRGAASLTD
jgi:hypothetical protein